MATFGSRAVAALALAGAASVALAAPAAAKSRHHTRTASSGVTYDHGSHVGGREHHRGGQKLVSDGPGTGFGFHRLPGAYRVGAAVARNRQRQAVHSAVIDDAVESYGYGPFYGGLVGSNGFGAGGYGNRGVFSYPDGYGSPYFAGYYGEGDGADLGPLGHAYAN